MACVDATTACVFVLSDGRYGNIDGMDTVILIKIYVLGKKKLAASQVGENKVEVSVSLNVCDGDGSND